MEDNLWSVTFDLTPISKDDDLKLVEIRVLLPPNNTATNITMKIFHTENGQGDVFLGSITKTMPASHHSAWKSFNVTNLMAQYFQWNNMFNETDIHAIESHSASRTHSDYPEKKMKNHVPLQRTATNQAIIVFFSKDKPFSKPGSPVLIKKLSENSPKMAGILRRRNRNNRQMIIPTNTYSMPRQEQRPLCRKVHMIVDFKELGWENWVVHPKKYNAYRCEGSCHIPLKDPVKTTNYDYIKVGKDCIATPNPSEIHVIYLK
ncbi:nodal homolog [Mantella aurantiaca]